MDENIVATQYCVLPARVTRARTAAFRASGAVLPLKPLLTKPENKHSSWGNSKCAVGDENNPNAVFPVAVQNKKRAVLKDVTNVCCESSQKRACCDTGCDLNFKPLCAKPKIKQPLCGISKNARLDENMRIASVTVAPQHKKRPVSKDVTNVYCESTFRNCINAAKVQGKNSQKFKLGHSKVRKNIAKKKCTGSALLSKSASASEKINAVKNAQCIRISEPQAVTILSQEDAHSGEKSMKNVQDKVSECGVVLAESQDLQVAAELFCPSQRAKDKFCEDLEGCTKGGFIDIDADHKDPQICGLYAPEIYTNLRVAELCRRPYSNFMEALQQGVTQSMRGILIDWLVEVSEEYKLVPDTLYLTVYLIDRFLSENYIERQGLQLLGITCMLIASKYEEISAPCVEEFCFITDNTYSKEDVIKMESQVLNYLGFQLSVPTIKTFLRRFVQAAEASYKVPILAFEFLANYLAELTLVEYSFVNFLPSVIAASAVFLARWTLDQSGHPWNLTLEHYTSYKASDLKATVFAMQVLQMNSENCSLQATHKKYRQIKVCHVRNCFPHYFWRPRKHELRDSKKTANGGGPMLQPASYPEGVCSNFDCQMANLFQAFLL